jgi:alpha-tubulin suppressor-like RCC1 family protein
VVGGMVFSTLTAGWYHNCALTSVGTAYCWGQNDRGQLGDGSWINRQIPVRVAGALVFAQLTAGVDYTCGRTIGGATYCWGYGGDGQLGDGTAQTRNVPVPVTRP